MTQPSYHLKTFIKLIANICALMPKLLFNQCTCVPVVKVKFPPFCKDKPSWLILSSFFKIFTPVTANYLYFSIMTKNLKITLDKYFKMAAKSGYGFYWVTLYTTINKNKSSKSCIHGWNPPGEAPIQSDEDVPRRFLKYRGLSVSFGKNRGSFSTHN